jgi:hypothetical protein
MEILESRKNSRFYLGYFSGIVLILLTIAAVFQGRLTRLDVPLTYGAKEPLSIVGGNLWRTDVDVSTGKQLFNQVDLYPSMSGVKSFIESGSFSSTRLNSVVGYNSAAFPTPSSQAQFVILKALSFFSNSPGMVINLYFFFSILLIYSLVFILLARTSKIALFAFIGAATFTLSPALYGKEQLFSHLGWVPVITTFFFIYEISKGSIFNMKTYILGALATSTFGMYGGIFSLILTTLAIFTSLILGNRNEVRSLSKLIGFQILAVFLMFYFSIRASLQFWKTNPKAEVLNRTLEQLEVWPFRLIDSMAFPGYSNLVPAIFKRSNFVPSGRFGEGVNTFGPYGIIAMVAAIYCLFKLNKNGDKKREGNFNELRMFSCLMVIVCLIAPLGGLLPGVSGFIDIPIKSWERLQIPISLVSLLVLGLAISNADFVRIGEAKFVSRFHLASVVVGIALVVGFLSAQPLGVFNNEAEAVSRWDREKAFFNNIDQTHGDIRILQLPKMTFPEGPPILGVPPYGDFVAHFQSSSLHLSAAEVGDSTSFNAEYSLSGSFSGLIEKVSRLAYDGVIIDRRATSEAFNNELNTAGAKLCSNFEDNKETNYVFCKFK